MHSFSSTSPSVIVENAPLNFVRAGRYYWSDGQLWYIGAGGYLWSTKAYDSTHSYGHDFRYDYFFPQGTDNNGYGFSVHWLQYSDQLKTNPCSSTSPSVIVENAPLNFVRGGQYYWSSGQIDSKSTIGYYWSTTASSSTYSRYFAFSSSSITPQTNYIKGYGFSVRCVYTYDIFRDNLNS